MTRDNPTPWPEAGAITCPLCGCSIVTPNRIRPPKPRLLLLPLESGNRVVAVKLGSSEAGWPRSFRRTGLISRWSQQALLGVRACDAPLPSRRGIPWRCPVLQMWVRRMSMQ